MKFYENNNAVDIEDGELTFMKSNKVKISSLFNVISYNKKYYFGFIFRNIFYVIHSSKTLKSLDVSYNPEDRVFVKYMIEKEYYNTTYNVRELISCPENRKMNIGDTCLNGCSKGIIIDKSDYFYYIKFNDDKNTTYRVVFWNDVFPIVETKSFDCVFWNPIRYYNSTLECLYTKVFHFGVDMNPEYQRGSVWTEEQEIKLIDSIFNNINIGSFVFAEKVWADRKSGDVVGDMYEIVDGKQRLTSIIHYIEGKFKYRGLYYHQLNPLNRHHFDNFKISVSEIQFGGEQYDKKMILNTFIRLNECGTSMNNNIIKRAKELL